MSTHQRCAHPPTLLRSANAPGIPGLLVYCGPCGLIVGPAPLVGKYVDLRLAPPRQSPYYGRFVVLDRPPFPEFGQAA